MATYGIDSEYMNIEVLIPIDKEIQNIGVYIYKKEIKIVNAIMMTYKGNPIGFAKHYVIVPI